MLESTHQQCRDEKNTHKTWTNKATANPRLRWVLQLRTFIPYIVHQPFRDGGDEIRAWQRPHISAYLNHSRRGKNMLRESAVARDEGGLFRWQGNKYGNNIGDMGGTRNNPTLSFSSISVDRIISVSQNVDIRGWRRTLGGGRTECTLDSTSNEPMTPPPPLHHLIG